MNRLATASRRSTKLFCDIDATALVSTMVVLFVILFVTLGTDRPHDGVSVNRPQVFHPVGMPGALQNDAMRLTVMRDGHIYFGTDLVHSVFLSKKIQEALKDRDVERKIYITADVRARYGSVKEALDGIRAAGILRVAFLVDQNKVSGAL